MTNTTTLATVDFHGQPLTVITGPAGEHLVAMKPICDNIGLDWKGQYSRIKRDDVLKEGVVVMPIPSAGGEQDTLCLPLDLLNGWLFGIDVSRCRKEIQPALIQYKRECYAVLAAHWQKREHSPAPSINTRRWLVCYDHNGKEHVTPVPDNACVMTRSEMLDAIVRPGELMVSTDELYQFAMAALANLKLRLDYQGQQLQRASAQGLRLS